MVSAVLREKGGREFEWAAQQQGRMESSGECEREKSGILIVVSERVAWQREGEEERKGGGREGRQSWRSWRRTSKMRSF
jgi:hypothetical protein